MPNWKMKGQYLKNCNCAASCTCDTTGFPSPHKGCEGVLGMHIQDGNFDGVNLSGVKWAALYHWPGALHEGNGTVEAFIDKKANEPQRNAIVQILTGQAGGPWFEVLASIVTKVEGPHFVDIEFQFDKEKRRAKLAVPGFFETTSQPLVIPATGDEQRVIVRMPHGMEYREMEVAQTAVMKASGAIKFNHTKTHSSLAHVEHTNKGLVG
jgi:hypothetical protein